ncbi:Rv3235 family protein [Umezawaea tangerina]|uniref:Secreted protein n=1 Tax=Umezawaea tangerina TaxID=84725 RepID=A0A2T0TE20_9PSEU|nr:Rv3235 family protein [Umezawaea tangerina]PRY43874.1 hypothetical protein CLV43_103623 [Umezawaea tangerina]
MVVRALRLGAVGVASVGVASGAVASGAVVPEMRVPEGRVVPELSEEEGRRLVVVVLEGVDGLRPLGQLAGVVSGEVLRGLRVEVGRSRLGRLRVCRVGVGVVEMAGTVVRGGRVRALAVRVEFVDGGWRCVVFRVLG